MEQLQSVSGTEEWPTLFFELALDLVQIKWERILRLADLLVEKKTLTPEEALQAYKEPGE